MLAFFTIWSGAEVNAGLRNLSVTDSVPPLSVCLPACATYAAEQVCDTVDTNHDAPSKSGITVNAQPSLTPAAYQCVCVWVRVRPCVLNAAAKIGNMPCVFYNTK